MFRVPTLSLVLLLVFSGLIAADPSEPQPTPSPTRIQQRKAIQNELDENHEAVQNLYELLDVAAKADMQKILSHEIQQFEDRNNVLFDQLDALDEFDFREQQQAGLRLQADRLDAEAIQLRKADHLLPAAARTAKAKMIRKALADGSWQKLAAVEWSRETKPAQPSLANLIKLSVEVESLRKETASLRREVQQLRVLVQQLQNK